MMPQFDIFSFFSQLFWLFTCFSLLYFILSYCLLPSLAFILKIRKRKLMKSSSAGLNSVDSLVDHSNSVFGVGFALDNFDKAYSKNLSAFFLFYWIWQLFDLSFMISQNLIKSSLCFSNSFRANYKLYSFNLLLLF